MSNECYCPNCDKNLPPEEQQGDSCAQCGEPYEMRPKPYTPRRISNAQFNNRYVRSNRGHKDEIRNASAESLQGTRDSNPSRAATPGAS
jgi:predicted amidophosphoribosyltransferase